MTGEFKFDLHMTIIYLVVDYFGEGPLPMMMQLIPVAYFNLSPVAVIHGVSSRFDILYSRDPFCDILDQCETYLVSVEYCPGDYGPLGLESARFRSPRRSLATS